MMVVGTIRMPTAMQLGLAMVRAASIPIWNLLPLNFLFSSSLTASANGIRPSIRTCIIFGVRTMVAAVYIGTHLLSYLLSVVAGLFH